MGNCFSKSRSHTSILDTRGEEDPNGFHPIAKFGPNGEKKLHRYTDTPQNFAGRINLFQSDFSNGNLPQHHLLTASGSGTTNNVEDFNSARGNKLLNKIKVCLSEKKLWLNLN